MKTINNSEGQGVATPDFYLPEADLFIEIKGRVFDKDKEEAKWNQFPYKLDIYNRERFKKENIKFEKMTNPNKEKN